MILNKHPWQPEYLILESLTMGGEDLLRELIRESVISLYDGTQAEYGSSEYVDELDRIVKELQHLKTSLRSGPDRYKNRKEVHRIQSAVEAIRYLKNRARRTGVRNGLITGDD